MLVNGLSRRLRGLDCYRLSSTMAMTPTMTNRNLVKMIPKPNAGIAYEIERE